MSTPRMMILSILPPKYPAMIPIDAPKKAAKIAAAMPTARLSRVPYINRASRSRPR